MYNVSVIITEDGRPALRLVEDRHSDCGERMKEQYSSGLNDKSAPVIIVNLCDDEELYSHACVIKN